ncbi:VOC family protein [Pedobacter sp. L105]|uniref:VOC family protein n=1 Tax=Pedobacter sp. L105 TaxID=1641871 RepID=UPI00131C5F26|nr:VOC family protein [Pedobacter sp. L105]
MKRITSLLAFTIIILSMKQSAAQNVSGKQTAAVLNHIAVYVTNLDKSAAFYEGLFNLPKMEEPFKDGKHVWLSLGPAGQLHLIKGAQAGVHYDKNEHLCFSVSSITAFIAKLDKEKIEYANWPGTAKAPTIRPDGVKQIYFQDPDGHWLEVNDQQ